jgi:Ca2+-binding RTX toxin-like protein
VVADVERSFTAACYLTDGSYPTFEVVARPAHGSFREQSPGVWLYRATKGYKGSDSFSYLARNGDATAATVVQRIRVIKPIPGVTRPSVDYCLPRVAGEQCGPGYGRRTRGGGDKVSHRNWPRVTGILWSVRDSANHSKKGGPLNDELLGHHGSDRISGRGGTDIIWGDWNPLDNSESQRDVLSGGAGHDFIYTSHGTNTVTAGRGNDHIWAFYGHGTINCGPGNDIVRVRTPNRSYKLRGCERRGKF